MIKCKTRLFLYVIVNWLLYCDVCLMCQGHFWKQVVATWQYKMLNCVKRNLNVLNWKD